MEGKALVTGTFQESRQTGFPGELGRAKEIFALWLIAALRAAHYSAFFVVLHLRAALRAG